MVTPLILKGEKMNLQEIRNFLKELFSKPLGDGKKRNIVFWYDINGIYERIPYTIDIAIVDEFGF